MKAVDPAGEVFRTACQSMRAGLCRHDAGDLIPEALGLGS
jgi:hypothetical protein